MLESPAGKRFVLQATNASLREKAKENYEDMQQLQRRLDEKARPPPPATHSISANLTRGKQCSTKWWSRRDSTS